MKLRKFNQIYVSFSWLNIDKFTEELIDKDTEIEENKNEISKLKNRLDRYKNN